MDKNLSLALEAVDKYRKFQFLVESLSVEKGLSKGHQDYQKFIVLTRARSGSNLLCDLLGSSSQILLFGELFQKKHRGIIWNHWQPKYYKSEAVLSIRENHPVQFLEDIVFRCYPRRIKAVGFKIFYNHAREPEWQPVWEYLKADPSIKIIHLYRRNILKVYLSTMIASKTRKHIQRKSFLQRRANSDNAQRSIELSYEGCLTAFEKTVNWQQEAHEFFAQHSMKNLVHEDFISNWDETLEDLQAFLGAKSEPLRTSMVKQSSQALADSISNYWELKEQFKETPWSPFFTQ
ncbi:MAG: sulfotransferase [Leptolyngbya sp. SIO1D8]|nr:sulfotransferase [Leptolyngbya sp. SIO1D8]